jgi:molecular chaperone GrpE
MTEPQATEPDDDNQEAAEGTQNAAAGDAQAEIARLKDQLLRALAETENTRRRGQKEREDTAKYAVANFAKEMLGVADNFHRALDAIPKELQSNPSVKNLIAGVDATNRQLQAALERFGIKKLDPLGQPFDPNFHRVMMEVDDPEQPPGTVVQVLQSGYMIYDRLLREALVAVAKGGPAVAPKVDTSA